MVPEAGYFLRGSPQITHDLQNVKSVQFDFMKHILRLVDYCKNIITSTQATFLP